MMNTQCLVKSDGKKYTVWQKEIMTFLQHDYLLYMHLCVTLR